MRIVGAFELVERRLTDRADVMKHVIPLILLLSAMYGYAVAEDAFVVISVDDLLADPSLLETHRYISTGQPDEQLLAQVESTGYVAVIDLRTAVEDRGMDEPTAVEAAGLTYYSLPIAGGKGITFDNARALDALLAEIDGPVFLHCRTGNRVGGLLALSARASGASEEEALVIGRKAGLTSLEPTVKERMSER